MKYEKKQKLQGNIQTYPIFVIFVYDVINKLLYKRIAFKFITIAPTKM